MSVQHQLFEKVLIWYQERFSILFLNSHLEWPAQLKSINMLGGAAVPRLITQHMSSGCQAASSRGALIIGQMAFPEYLAMPKWLFVSLTVLSLNHLFFMTSVFQLPTDLAPRMCSRPHWKHFLRDFCFLQVSQKVVVSDKFDGDKRCQQLHRWLFLSVCFSVVAVKKGREKRQPGEMRGEKEQEAEGNGGWTCCCGDLSCVPALWHRI